MNSPDFKDLVYFGSLIFSVGGFYVRSTLHMRDDEKNWSLIWDKQREQEAKIADLEKDAVATSAHHDEIMRTLRSLTDKLDRWEQRFLQMEKLGG